MEKLLIINADDFGFTEGVNEGIIRAHTEGVVTSTSVMTREKAANDAETLNEHPDLSVGLHYQIHDKEFENRIRKGERLPERVILRLQQDFYSQVQEFESLTGKPASHIDSHYSVHEHPDIAPFIRVYCTESQISRRGAEANLVKDFFGRKESGQPDLQRVSVEALLRIIDSLPGEINELMCHPGLVDTDLNQVSGYTKEREAELSTLTDQQIVDRLNQPDIEPVNWTDPRILVRT